MITLDQFITEWAGRGVNLPEDHNPYGFQCVELVNEWLKELGLAPFPYHNAQDFDELKGDTKDYVWTQNTPTNVPGAGDIVVFRGADLPFGHVDIFDRGNVNQFYGFDQNYPLNTLPHLQLHTYHDVEGWLHPKVLDVPVDDESQEAALITALQAQLSQANQKIVAEQTLNSQLIVKIAAARTALQ